MKAVKNGVKISPRMESWVKNFKRQKDMLEQLGYSEKQNDNLGNLPYGVLE